MDADRQAQTIEDAMDPWAAGALVATLGLGRPAPRTGDPLPPFWHWLHFLEAAPRGCLGPDGHPAPGTGLIPKVAQPRRMWAGGRLTWHAPLPLGTPARRVSRVTDIAGKSGRQGPLSFVTVAHEITGAAGLAVTEEQDIVYREDVPHGARPAPKTAPADETHRADWALDETVLFRYSALTFNGHRIHYDLAYARGVEGYPGLVVHGPLLATLLLELADSIAGPPARFAFRATAPVFANEAFSACARPGDGTAALWIRAGDGRLAMTAEAGW